MKYNYAYNINIICKYMILLERYYMKKIMMEIKYWSQIFLLPLYLLSYIMPRNKKIWVLGSTFGYRFADNPKYFYLYLHQHMKDMVRPIWISRDKSIVHMLRQKDYEAYYLKSFKGAWYCLRAKVYLYDNYSKDICFTLSGGAIKINLWHGVPLKKIQKDNIFDKVRNPRNKLEKIRWSLRRMTDEKPSDYVLTTSEFLKPIFSSAFNTKNTIICGYPRNDFLISDDIDIIMNDDEKRICNIIENKAIDNKILLYMPTFRDSEYRFFEVVSITKFEEFLKEHNLVFFVKLHPKSKLNDKFMEVQSECIRIINSEQDPYPLLKLADVLITDYSSIYFDFLLKNKPIIFFSYDLDEYLMETREMYFDYVEMTPGEKAKNEDELEDAIVEALSRNNLYTEERNKIKNMVFYLDTEISSETLYKKIKDICS